MVVASRDWHPPGHVSFRERGGPWPSHCVQGTDGAAFHPALRLPAGAWIVSKGTDPDRDAYSAFGGAHSRTSLRGRGVRRLWVGGLAEDVLRPRHGAGRLEGGLRGASDRGRRPRRDVHPATAPRPFAKWRGRLYRRRRQGGNAVTTPIARRNPCFPTTTGWAFSPTCTS